MAARTMTLSRIAAVLLGVAALLGSAEAVAGLAPLDRSGKKAHLARESPLKAQQDTVRYRVLPDRVEVEQRLVLTNPGSGGAFLLGLPLPRERKQGPQDVSIQRVDQERLSRLRTWRVPSFGWRPVDAWRVCSIRLGAGERIELRATWWQPHAAGLLHGYPRFLLSDPLWSAGAFSGPVEFLERYVDLEGGAVYSSSRPGADPVAAGLGEVDWEHQDRRFSRQQADPGSKDTFTLYYKLTRGAHSRCTDADPWLALDGDPDTVWRPKDCPNGEVALELPALCRGFGTREPACDQAAVPFFDLGMAVRTQDRKARAPVVVEGWWGPGRSWRVSGRQNRRIWIKSRQPVTRYRVVFPKGLPKAGAGEILLARLDLKRSDPGAVDLLLGRRWLKIPRRCRFRFDFVNPISIRHVTLGLRPRSRMDTFMVSTDCSDDRTRVPYHEPVPCNHTPEELAEARKALGEPDLEEFPHENFKRKHRWRIELDLDPTCHVTELRVIAPSVCTDKYRPFAPRVRLDF